MWNEEQLKKAVDESAAAVFIAEERAYLNRVIVGIILVLVALIVGINIGRHQARVERVVCDSVEWEFKDGAGWETGQGVYGGEKVATCTANNVNGRQITVHLID